MRPAFIALVISVALILSAWGVLFLIYGPHLNARIAGAFHDALYDFDPRTYPYMVDCPVAFNFEARCNPKAIHDRRYVIDGAQRRVPAQCQERVVHAFFRNLPRGALGRIAGYEERSKSERCASTIDYPSESGGFTPQVMVSGYFFRGHPVLVVKFDGKHTGIPRDYESFEWLGEEIIEFEKATYATYRVRIHPKSGDELECLYIPYDMILGGELYPVLKGSFVCSGDFDVTRAFVIDQPIRSPDSLF
jgi:hypothetical protein